MPLYDIDHDTIYRYDGAVLLSQQIAHLRPRECAGQRCLSHSLDIVPDATRRIERIDFFGNPVTGFGLYAPHDTLAVHARTRVLVEPETPPQAAAGPPWEAARDHLRDGLSGHAPLQADARDAGQYRFASAFVPFSDESARYADYALQCFTPGRPLVEALLALSARMHADFSFDPSATSVATPVAEVFARRRGVCQDFSHLMIACLRALGLAARYVSGYLLTEPPPGQPRLAGADASHAWVAAWCPGLGWVEVDPTNDVRPGTGHITLAWGRDYGDVCPLRGVILGGGGHSVEVAVTVMPVADEAGDGGHAPQ
ncbi:transglutaminase family protein [Thauera sinica]|uniref:Transglutaminase N-terminal domain-containing protein n=1 Tax=Thauera sinica TaxID=2665146 RepID=A0ABW1AQ81_9RHOO|nr:transglutaminase family protein [Thauera sp. K11]ATE61545.1 transglutaminase [Thauera sp. K11]